MQPAVQAFLIVQIFRFFCLLAGCALAYMGYRLFALGLYEKQGELKASYGKSSLVLRQVGPGVFFALFGIAMAYTGFLRRFEAGPAFNSVSTIANSPTNVPERIAYDQAETKITCTPSPIKLKSSAPRAVSRSSLQQLGDPAPAISYAPAPQTPVEVRDERAPEPAPVPVRVDDTATVH